MDIRPSQFGETPTEPSPSSARSEPHAPADDAAGPLAWPPPGLESAQGAARSAIPSLAIAAAALFLPLLVSIAGAGGYREAGPFASMTWPLAALAFVGALAAADGVRRLVGLLRTAARASGKGYGLATIAAVAVDGRRDTGELLRGERPYASLGESERAWLVRARIAGAAADLAAVGWIPVGFLVGAALAGDGVPRLAIWAVCLGPSALFAFGGVLCRALDGTVVKGARRRWEGGGGAAELDRAAEAWNRRYDMERGEAELGRGAVVRPAALRAAWIVLVLCAAPVLLRAFGLAAVGAAGSAIADVVVPRWSDRALSRLAAAEPLRPLRLEPDPGITPREAGDALQSLVFVARERELPPLVRPPARTYDRRWFPEDGRSALAVPRHLFGRDLLRRVADEGLGPDERAYLETVAAHPASAEFETLARAAAVDVLGARWVMPLPDTVAAYELPFPSMNGVRPAARARLARAALALDAGRADAAEHAVREVISVGFVLLDEGPTLIDNLIGGVTIRLGGGALEQLYRATGRTDAADALVRAQDAVRRATDVRRSGAPVGRRAADLVHATPGLVEDPTVPRGMRWGRFALFNTVVPCMGVRRLVFGSGDGYDDWIERARESLVRFPADAEFFDLMQRGHLTDRRGRVREAGWAAAAMPLLTGRDDAAGCAALVRGVLGI